MVYVPDEDNLRCDTLIVEPGGANDAVTVNVPPGFTKLPLLIKLHDGTELLSFHPTNGLKISGVSIVGMVASYPGVTADGLSPGGLGIAGAIKPLGGAVITGAGGAATALEVRQSTGATGLLANYYDHTGAQVAWIGGDGELVTNDDIIALGHINCHTGFAAWNHAIPNSQPSITGNVTTGILSDLQGVVGAILTALDGTGLLAKNTT